MSGSENPVASGAVEIDRRAAYWLQRRQFWDRSEEDDAAFEAWLAESEAHRIAYWRQNAMWGRTERLAALRGAEPEPVAARKPLWPVFLQAAAGFAAIVTLGAIAAGNFAKPHDRIFTTPVGGREVVNFADGSRIELNTDTVLRARMNTEQRLVWLDKGEAFFEVKHDPAHPFVVMIGAHRVTDLGTKFLIHRAAGETEVALIEGRAWFDRSDKQASSQAALLTPGDEVIATAHTMSVARRPAAELATELSWRHGVLVFKRTRLADAVAQFNRYNRQKLVVSDAAAASITIDGTFPTDGVRVFTDAIQSVFGLRIEDRGDETVISRAQ